MHTWKRRSMRWAEDSSDICISRRGAETQRRRGESDWDIRD